MKTLYKTITILLATLVTLSLNACIQLDGASGGIVVRDRDTRVSVYFSDHDRSEIHSYYAGRRLPPGLAKRNRLPPGLERQLERKGTLPHGLQSRELPGDLEKRLSPLPRGYVRLQVGTSILIKNVRTNVIVDIIKDVAR